ncbi:MAG: ABC transporter permease [Gemmatimonadales bacterium]|nr:ABC transporter permease [Gemmatimonadales bacterium]
MPIFRLPDDPRRAGGDVQKEIDLHLELKAKELEAAGLETEEARRAARASFGDPGAVAAECREVRSDLIRWRRRREFFGDLRQDLRVAVRGLRRAPGFTLVAILTLALGIGANAAIFAVVRSVLLAPLPYPEADRLVQLWTDERARGRLAPEWLTPPDFLDWRDQNRTFASMAAYIDWSPDLTGTGDPEALGGAQVSWNYFATLGVRPALGRDFRVEDDDAGAEAVIMLSDRVWRNRFGADPGIIGQALTLNGEPWTVVGVLGPDFRAPLPAMPDVWRPLRRLATSGCGRDCIVLRAVGRLRPGVTLEQAHHDLAGIAGELERTYPDTNRDRGVWLIPLRDQLTGASRLALWALAGAVGMVLLIACVNLANLLLVRGAGRARELAIRAALGAGRSRLLRQLLTENVLLAVLGGGLGLALAFALQGGLTSIIPASLRQVRPLRMDYTVVGFTAGVAILAGLLFGLVPALRTAGGSLMRTLRSGRDAGRDDARLRSGLVVVQLALSVILLVGAGLLMRSFVAMQRHDLGIRTDGVVTARVSFPRARYLDPAHAVVAVEDLLGRLRSNQAVRAVEVIDRAPFVAGDQDVSAFPVGEPPPEGNNSLWVRIVSPGLMPTLGMRMVSGRGFEPGDRAGSRPVVIVNEEAARRFWRGKDPVGRTLATSGRPDAEQLTVIGVVADVSSDGPRAPIKPELYIPIGQYPARTFTVIIQPVSTGAAALAALRASLAEVDPLVPIFQPGTLEQAAAGAVALPRTYAVLVGIFAAAALALAALGIYGVMAFSVAQRHREIGVRIALGATPHAIRRMILGQGARLVVVGAIGGAAGAFLASRAIRSMLFGVGPFDLVTVGVVLVVLTFAGFLAAWLPARRATRIDPLTAIQAD